MTTASLPENVRPVRDRHGKLRYRFRRKGWPSAYLPGDPGSAEFHRTYAEIQERGPLEKAPAQSPRKVAPRSLDDLFLRMKRSAGWQRKKAATQLAQARVYDRFLDRVDRKGRRYGERPVDSVTVGWLDGIFGDMAATPGAANDLRKKLKVLLEYACAIEWRTSNPVRHTAKFAEGNGYHTWSDAEIALYRAVHPLGSMARLTLELALNTAARRCNIAALTRESLRGGRLIVDHAKGNNATSVPVLASTRAAIDALPAAPIRHLIVSEFGKPFSVAGLGNRFRKWCDQADLPQCSMHGLRKATARMMAEAGATDAEIMAVTGHKKPATAAYYRADAARPLMADKGLGRLVVQPETSAVVQPEEK
jgi:integrase